MEPGCSPHVHGLAQMGKRTVWWQIAPWGAESAPGWQGGFPAACAAGTDTERLAGCSLPGQPGMQGVRSGVVMVTESGFGDAAIGFVSSSVSSG